MQKSVIYVNFPDEKLTKEQVSTKLLPLYETAKKSNLKIVNHYFEKINSTEAFLDMLKALKNDDSLNNVIMDTNDIILNENLFMQLLELKRNIYIVGEKTTNVITPDFPPNS